MRFWQSADTGIITHAEDPPGSRHKDISKLLAGTRSEPLHVDPSTHACAVPTPMRTAILVIAGVLALSALRSKLRPRRAWMQLHSTVFASQPNGKKGLPEPWFI